MTMMTMRNRGTEATLVELADAFAWACFDWMDGDGWDLALLYEYIYREGTDAMERGDFYLPEPRVVEVDWPDNDMLVPSEEGDTWATSDEWYLLTRPRYGAHDHSIARRIWHILSFSDLGMGRPWGPLLMERFGDVLSVMRIFVDAWLEQNDEFAYCGASDKDAYLRVCEILRGEWHGGYVRILKKLYPQEDE